MIIQLLIPSLRIQEPQALNLFAPSLMRLVMRGQKHHAEWPGLEYRLAEALGFDSGHMPFPIAASLRKVQGLAATDRWICATPVSLEIGIEKIMLHEPMGSSLQQDEAISLVDSFNTHFTDDGLFLEIGRSDLWFMRLPDHLDIRTQPLSIARGQSIYPLLPEGEDAAYWHGLLNEVQMLFYNHPVNISREREEKRSINGIWLWGEGEFTEPAGNDWDLVITDDPVSMAMAKSVGIKCIALEGGLQTTMQSAMHYERVLVVDDSLQILTAYGDYNGWSDEIVKLESNLFKPLCHAWNQGKIKELTIESDGLRVEVPERSRWQFWRRC